MASGSLAARKKPAGRISFEKRLESFKLVNLEDGYSIPWPSEEPPYAPREWHQDPEWITELCETLPFPEMFRYKFARSGHINVNEARTYKTW